MIARAAREDGASLIFALVFLTVVGIAVTAIASMGFTSQRSAAVFSDNRREVNALDGAIQAATENVRVRELFACDAAPLPVPGPRAANVGCVPVLPPDGPLPTDTRKVWRFTAALASPPACPAPQPPSLVATVDFSTIGDTPTGARIARATSWRVVPSTIVCRPS